MDFCYLFFTRPEGVSFTTEVPEDFQNEVYPKKGDIISFSFQNFSKNEVPVDPQLYRIREDLTWKDVVQNFLDQVSQPNYINGIYFCFG